MRLVLLFSDNISLVTWASFGMLEREVKFYRRLADRGIEIVFVTYGDDSDYQWRDKWPGITIFPLFSDKRKPSKKILFWLYSLWLPRRIKTVVPIPDLIKTNQIIGGLVAAQMKRLWGRPLLVRCGYDPYQFELSRKGNTLKTLFIRWYSGVVYRSADRIHVASQIDASFVRDKYLYKLQRDLEVRPNWVDTGIFSPAAEMITNLEKNRVLAIGRATDQKNFQLLIRAIALGPYGLDLITDENEKANLMAISEKVGADVRIFGRVPHIELPAIYCRYPVYVISSKYEGHPKTLLEAMACGRAVVGTRVAGISEVIEDHKTGLLVEETPQAIQQAIANLMVDVSLRERLGREASKKIHSEYSLEDAVTKELATYQEMIADQ